MICDMHIVKPVCCLFCVMIIETIALQHQDVCWSVFGLGSGATTNVIIKLGSTERSTTPGMNTSLFAYDRHCAAGTIMYQLP